ncbi:hypothetical protein RJ639_043866 [Escallonia herrerae]|uniref:HAT C-terminal dimerisation domain-containing protein n=1 Tax=Escallonia herrerae TaxID=1293975 RepID=A0AA88WE10_9ASTE|nr:hypothetical protein RJ639_043866 [Escallonia herrerae]
MARRLKTSACVYFQRTNDRCDRNSDDGDNGNEHVFDKQKAYRAMAMFVCTEKVSPRAFLGDSFKEVLKITNPGFHVSFATLERHCLKLYEEETEKIKQVFRDLDGQVSLSMDILRHDTYNVCSYKLPEGQTVFDYMCLTVHFIDDKWKLNNRVVYFGSLYYTTEYAPEKVILKCLSDLEIENKVSTVTMLNGFEYDDMAEAVKDRVQGKKLLRINDNLFRISCCAHLFRLMVEEAFDEIEWTIRKICHIVPFGKSLPQWHLTLDISQEALELESKGEYLKEDEYGCFDIPSAKEWKQVRGVCKLVGHIYKAAEITWPIIRKRMTIGAIQLLQVLNPMKRFLGTLSRDAEIHAMSFIVWSSITQFIRSNSLPKSELELYLEEPILPWSKDFNLLNWWKAASAKYPTLSKIARDLLAIPLSVATSFDAYYYTDFRKANGDVVCLGPDLANALMCTRSWIKKHRRDIN